MQIWLQLSALHYDASEFVKTLENLVYWFNQSDIMSNASFTKL